MAALSASPKDLARPEYQEIKHSLSEMVRINREIRFAYIYLEKAGQLYFVVDSEPDTSKIILLPARNMPKLIRSIASPSSAAR